MELGKGSVLLELRCTNSQSKKNGTWEGVCTVGIQVCHFPVEGNGGAQEMHSSQFEGAYSASREVPPLYQCYQLLNDWSTL